MQQLTVYTDAAKGEVSGLFTVEVYKETDFLMKEVFLYEQESTSGGTELNPADQIQVMEKLIAEGREDVIVDLKGWWHTHGSGGVFWSGTDTTTQEKEYTPPYLISLVMNKKGETKARLNVYSPIVILMDLDVSIAWHVHENAEAWVEEVKAKVQEPKRNLAGHQGYKGNGGPYYQGQEYYRGNGHWERGTWVPDEEVKNYKFPTDWMSCTGAVSQGCIDKPCLKRKDRACTKYVKAEDKGTPLASKITPIKTRKAIEEAKEKLDPEVRADIEAMEKLGIIVVDSEEKVPLEEMTEAEIKKLSGEEDNLDFKEVEEMFQSWKMAD
jgi:hypothetical protein